MNHIDSLTIRPETTADHYAVEALTRDAFWRFWEPARTICDEHLLVHRLRSVPSLVPELNLVAELDGRLVGHIIYTESKIVDDDAREYDTLTFGPLTVLPELQGFGIGQALLRRSFEIAARLGYRAVLIFGHPSYYPRAGFRPAAEFGIATHDGQNFDAFMAYPLYDGALDSVHGRYFIDPVYEGLTEEAALEFDKRFPPKEPFTPRPIGLLLDHLNPDARKSLAGFPSLDFITAKSRRELAALSGMDDAALNTVRTVLREHGVRWG